MNSKLVELSDLDNARKNAFWRSDLVNDARCCREQSENGPYFPDRGVTRENLLKWAEFYERKAGIPVPRENAFNSQMNQ